ncbi:MAG: flagellar biosynthesis anti-sigma factor FlgM [Acidipila sp.]|nr:flagellar biosynthesis anti-sigma factor FlgM [Acidipila sp.]
MQEANNSCQCAEAECVHFDREANFRRLRIEQLCRRIVQGSYRVSAREIAAAMLIEEDETQLSEVLFRNEQEPSHGNAHGKPHGPHLH